MCRRVLEYEQIFIVEEHILFVVLSRSSNCTLFANNDPCMEKVDILVRKTHCSSTCTGSSMCGCIHAVGGLRSSLQGVLVSGRCVVASGCMIQFTEDEAHANDAHQDKDTRCNHNGILVDVVPPYGAS